MFPVNYLPILIIALFVFIQSTIKPDHRKSSSRIRDKNYIKNMMKKQDLILTQLKNKMDKIKKTDEIQPIPRPIINEPQIDPVYIRDNQVLNDRLYPPLGRTERPQFDILQNFINNQSGLFNVFTRGPPDTFRPIGYLTPKNKEQTIDSTLILYGRAKYPNSDLGEFYVSSSNKMSDIKIPLNDNNSNVKKITDVPYDVLIKGNMLNGEYDYTELPKADLTYPYI